MNSYVEHSICEVCNTDKERVAKIFENAFSSRNGTGFSYRPFQLPFYTDSARDQGLNFAEIYPEFKEGDYVYIKCCMDGMYERDMMLLIQKTDNPEVYFNDEKCEIVDGPYGKDAYVRFKKGKNHILIKITAKKDGFAAYILPVVPGIRYIACGEYQYRTWQYIDKKGAGLSEGFEISRLYKPDENPEKNEIEWIYPIIPKQSEEKIFDFKKMCSDGKAAYAYTCVKGKIKIEHNSPLGVFNNKEKIYYEESGEFVAEFADFTPLLFKSINSNNAWGFSVTNCEKTALPFAEGAECPDLQWLWTGPFGQNEDSCGVPYGPEVNLNFDKPYVTSENKNILWKFYREKTYLKPYNHTAFFGHWYYAIMVGHFCMLCAAKKIGREDFYDFYIKSIKTMCSHRDYALVLKRELGGESIYLVNSLKLGALDFIGTIGMNVAELYQMTADEDARYTLKILADAIKHNVPRFSDGTFHRKTTMWTDDTYMSLPFLARLGAIYGDESYFDDILAQVRGFSQRMYMDDCDLFSHIFFLENEAPNRIPWGRGNGWVLLALSEVLSILPESYHGREEILKLYQKLASGVIKFRDEKEKMWHQVLNNSDSYIEASGSAMFITALARGIKNGWIEKKHRDFVLESWNSLCEKCIDTDGNVYGVCMGSSCSMQEEYYLKLGTMVNDDHGVGIILGAGVEVMNMTE